MSRRVAILGSRGQVAHDLFRVWPQALPDDELIGLSHADVEVAARESVDRALSQVRPNLVINTAAYHRVDEVEDNPERAFAVNATGALNVARWCRDAGATVMFISTDYVFDRRTEGGHSEDEVPAPPNVYGVTKLAGEHLVRQATPRHFIVRSSGLYGVAGPSGKGSNFVELMLRLAAEGRPIRVVNDQTLTPTPTLELARQIAELAGAERYGLYHASCQGECTWFDFAQEIFRLADVQADLTPQTTEQSGARARRPTYSVLDNRRLRVIGLDQLPSWQEGLAGYLKERKERLRAATAAHTADD